MSLKNKISDLSKVLTDGMNRLSGAMSWTFAQQNETYQAGAPVIVLDYIGEVISVHVNGVQLHTSEYSHNGQNVNILGTLEADDRIRVDYIGWPDIYGIEWDAATGAPEVKKIGNAALHALLPIQSKMKRCLLLDDGTLNYYLHDDDSTKKADGTNAVLDGSDGQVMVEIPRYWRKTETNGNMRRELFSENPIPGGKEIPKMYISAYKASLDRPNNKLSSVVNMSANYRGGNNQASWDSENEFKSMLGKPVTVKNRIEFRAAAKNRGENWYDMIYQARESIALLITLEYGTRHHQSAISQGLTNVNSQDWLDFNSRYPLSRCGATNSLGNKTGEVQVTLQDFPVVGQNFNTQVFSYRGIENFWGDIWEWTNDINVLVSGGIGTAYQTTGKEVSDTDVEGYKLVGTLAPSNGYIDDMIPGTILPASTSGASSSTYWTDYFYINADGLRGLLCGGHAYQGALAGSFLSNAYGAPTHAAATIGSRLCFLAR